MENFNKVLSFALGLVIVVVFLAVISGKIDLRKRIPKLFSRTTSSQSLSPTPKPTMTVAPATGQNQYQNNYSAKGGSNIKTIPATGSPTALLPILLFSLGGGIYLRKKIIKTN